MALRSMTGFAQIKAQVSEQLTVSLSLKAVNHRFLDLHFRLPAEADALEMRLRRLLKEHLSRGHVEVNLNLERRGGEGLQLNRELIHGYLRAFRDVAGEYNLASEPDLNAVLRLPGALSAAPGAAQDPISELEATVLKHAEAAIKQLNLMREEEGRGADKELRRSMAQLQAANNEIGKLRQAVSRAYLDKVRARMSELVNGNVPEERILQEAAMLAERSDIQEELVRMNTHVEHFVGMLDSGGEVGKKLDFLLQEMNREANTMLSKTSGVAGDALRLTELGLEMKSEIEKAREQVQNLE